MSASRWAVSLLLACHLTSIALASLPPGIRPDAVGPPRHPTDDPIAARLTPYVDRGARVVARLGAAVLRATRPIRRFAGLYVNTTGLGQTWNMFSRPWTANRYARLRYYVTSSHAANVKNARPTWMATEMVFPALRADDRMHFLRAYRAFPWDKAFIASIEASVRSSSTSQIPSDLAPVVRYFTNRFQRNHLVDGERIVRTEVWLGTSPVRPRGSSGDPQSYDARWRALTESYADTAEEAVWRGDYPPLRATEMQEDVVWQLEFFEE